MTLPEPFTAIAYPDYRMKDDKIQATLKTQGQSDPCFACGWPNLRVAALMGIQVGDQFDNPISNVEVQFAYRPDPVPAVLSGLWVRSRPGNKSPGRLLKVADYRACLVKSVNPLWGECEGEAASVVARSSSQGAYAYVALGDSPLSYYYFDVKSDQSTDAGYVSYPTSGWACEVAPGFSCSGEPNDPIISMGRRARVTNRFGNVVEAYAPDAPATFELWVDELSEDAEVFTGPNGSLNVRGLNTWRRERLLDSVITLEATTPGTLTTPSAPHIGNGTYRGEMTMAAEPQLNTVRYTGKHIPLVIPYIGSGAVDPSAVFTDANGMQRVKLVKDPTRAITTSDDFSLWGARPRITRVEPTPILVDGDGTVTRPSRIEYTITPEDYRKLLAPGDVVFAVRNGADAILTATAQARPAGGLDTSFDIPRGLFMAPADYTASVDVVGVSAAGANVNSAPFPVPTCPLVGLDTPTVVMSYTRDPVNGVTCGNQEAVVFTLCRDARVTLTVAESVVTGGVDNGTSPVAVTDLLLTMGRHRVLLPPGIVTGDDMLPFAIRAVDSVDPSLELTEPGTLVAAFRNRSVLPVGHTFVKGVDLYDGHVVRQGTDIKIAGRHLGLEMTRTYSSVGRGPKGLIGAGWAWNWEATLSPSGNCGLVSVSTPDGSSQVFRTTDGGQTFKPQKGYHTTLRRATDGSYDFIDKSGTLYRFRAPADPNRPDEDRRLEYVEEPHGDRLVPTYDNKGLITQIAEVHQGVGEVRKLEITYKKIAKFDRVVRAVAPDLAMEATYAYDGEGNLASATVSGQPVASGSGQGAGRAEQFEYSVADQRDKHQMLSAVDPNGSRTEYLYYRKADPFPGQGNGTLAIELKEEFVRRVREFAGSGPVPEPITEFQYDYTEALSSRFKTTVKDPRGNETLYVMNGNGSPLEIREPLGRITKMQWATDDIYKVREIDPLSRVTTYGYDARGNLTSEAIAAADGAASTQYEYDGRFNKLTLKTDAEGRSTRYEIDPDTGDLLAMTDAVGNTTGYRYDASGRLTDVIDPRGHSTSHRDHDSFGNAREIVDPLGNRTAREYDVRGRLVSETDTLGRAMTTTYDGLDRPIEVRRAAGGDSDDAVTTTEYYAGGQVITTTNPGGVFTSYALDGMNRVTNVAMSDGVQSFTTQMTLDGNGNAIKEVDRRGIERAITYDALNRATETAIVRGVTGEGPLGVVAKYTYDLAGNKLSEMNVAGLTTNYVYDGLYRVVEKRLPEGAPRYVERFAYDKVGNKTSVKDANGNETKYGYDGLNRVIRTENALGQVTTATFRDPEGSKVNKGEDLDTVRGLRTTYSYDLLNRESRRVVSLEGAGSSGEAYETLTSYQDGAHSLTVRDPRGTVTSVRLDGLDHAVEQILDPGGLALTTRTTYDGLGNRKRVVDPEQHATQYRFDGFGRLRQVTDAAGQTTSTDYDGDGLKTQETDRRGVVRRFTYDNLGRSRVATLTPSLSGVGWRHETRYEDQARKRRDIDVRLKETVSDLDGLDRAVRVTDPAGLATVIRYDGVNKRAETNKRGHTTTFDYDAVNRLTRVTDPAPLSYTSETTYDDALNRRSEKDRRGISRVVQMDSLGRVRSSSRAGVLQESNEYDANSNRTVTRDAESKQSRFTYDRGNRMTVRVDGDGSAAAATTTFVYDKDGLATEERDARAAALGAPFSIRNTYEAVHRLETVTDGEAHTTRYAYDGEGSRTLIQEPGGAATSFTYEETGKLVSVVQPGGRTTRHAYDGARNRIRQTDASNHVVEYAYDDLNRLTRMTQDPGGLALVTDYVYDENGNPRSIVDPKRQTTTSVFDELDRLKSKSFAFAPGDPLRPWRYTTSVAYEYDPNGNVLEARDSVASGSDPPITLTTTRVYDDFDRLTSEASPLPDGGFGTVGYSYFRNGVRQSMTDPQGVSTSYAYDGQNRLDSVTTPGGITRYEYFGDDLLERITYPNGVTATSGYDRADRLTSLVNAHGSTVVSSYAYDYDANGNRLSQVETNGGPGETTTYTYDALNRLETVTYPVDSAFPAGRAVGYGYDDVGNRTRETERTAGGVLLADKQGSFDNANRLTELRDLVAPAGTTVFGWDRNGNQVSKAVGGVTTVFQYDLRDRMVETRRGTSVLARMQYDCEGRRTKKIGLEGIVQYVYDQASVLAEYNAAGTVAATYEYGSDRLLSLVRPDEGRRWYSLDGLRSVVNLTDDSGGLVASYHLDAWGNFRFPTELGASKNHFAFTGYEWDPELGLFNAKARYFDPQIGRFISQDSFLGQLDGPPSLHRYLYANANSLRFVDPTGHGALDYVRDAGQSLYGFGRGVAKGAGNFVVGAAVGTGRLAIIGAKLQFGTPAMKAQAAHQLGELGNAIGDSVREQGRLLGEAASDPGQILDAAADIGPQRYGEVIGGATFDAAVTSTIFTGVGAARGVARVAATTEAAIVQEGRVAAATAQGERMLSRAAAGTTSADVAAVPPGLLPRVAGGSQGAVAESEAAIMEVAASSRITDPARLLTEARPTTLTREQVARFRGTGRERGAAFDQYLSEAHGSTSSAVETQLGRRVHDVGRVQTGTVTEMAVEGKNYLRFRMVEGQAVRGQVPLSGEIQAQIYKDVLWRRAGSKLGVDRLVQWEFAGAGPGGELTKALQRWGLPYVQ